MHSQAISLTQLRFAGMGLLLAALAACGSSSAPGIETLGAAFQRAFNQASTDVPVDVGNAGLTKQLGADPFEL
ncbi:MAG: hypothetical protein ACWA5A_07395 [Marinibacterium sp.]